MKPLADPGKLPDRAGMPVVVDTSVLLLPFTATLDLHDETQRLVGHVRFILADSVARELEHLRDAGDGATARAAAAALRWSASWVRGTTDLPGDDGVLDVARRLEAALITNDKAMQAEAARSGLRVLAPRGHGLAFL